MQLASALGLGASVLLCALAPAALGQAALEQTDEMMLREAEVEAARRGPTFQTNKAEWKHFQGQRMPEWVERPRERAGLATVWHVDPVNGFNGANGLSWASPYPTLTFATFQALPGDEIWLANTGSYDPSKFYIDNGPGASRLDSFVIPSGVTIRGGFAGTELSAGARPANTRSTLDASGQSNYHVVQVFGQTGVVLERLEIQNGLADGPTINEQLGGGMLIVDSEVTFIDVRILNNTAQSGGGIFAQNSNLTHASVFGLNFLQNNTATDSLGAGNGFGGGMFLGFGSSQFNFGGSTVFTIGNVANVGGGVQFQQTAVSGPASTWFSGDDAVVRPDTSGGIGGGINLFLDATAPTASFGDLTFGIATADESGGGLFLGGDGAATIGGFSAENCDAGTDGGAVFVEAGTSLAVADWNGALFCSAGRRGGAIAFEGDALDLTLGFPLGIANFGFCSAGTEGGAISARNGRVEVQGGPGVGFSDCSAPSGGAVVARLNAEIDLTDVVLLINTASGDGGALALRTGASHDLVGCKFDFSNAVGGRGGAIFATNGAQLTLDSTVVEDGDAADGAGVYMNSGTLTVVDSTFEENDSATSGSLTLVGAGPHTVSRSRFLLGDSPLGAAIQAQAGTNLSLENVLMTGATGGAPAMHVETTAVVDANHVTIANNPVGMNLDASATVNMVNSVVWNNGVDVNEPGGGLNLTYSAAPGALGASGTGNINADPLLNGSFGLSINSPAIDAGNSPASISVPTDLDGNPRSVDDTGQPDTGVFFPPAVVDMGAFEFQGTSEPLVVMVPTDAPNGVAGIGLVRDGGTVILEQQFFFECLDTAGKNLTLISLDPLDPVVVAGTRVVCPNGSALLVTGGSQAVVDGLTLESVVNGAGINVLVGDAQVHRAVLTGNKPAASGGAAGVDVGATADFFDTSFEFSTAVQGGGLAVFGQATLTDCVIEGNEAVNNIDTFPARGGGVYVVGAGSSLTIDRTEIVDNTITLTPPDTFFNEGGGLLALFDATLKVTNSLIAGNDAGRGQAISSFDSDLTVINSTIADNTATVTGVDGAIYSFGPNGNLTLRNTILNGNTDPSPDANDDLRLDGPGTVEYNNIGSLPASGTNISADPLFVGRVAGDFRLLGGSPSIDAGDNGPLLMNGIDVFDLDLNARIVDDTGTPDTGLGGPPTADHGAYEFQGTTIPCLADLNGDGILDNGDIQTFLAFFLAGNLGADLNMDGILDNGDIQTFLVLFLAGC